MKLVTSNMGCAWANSPFRRTHDTAWDRLLALAADIVLVQEAHPPRDVLAAGYLNVVDRTPNWGTAILIRADRACRPVTVEPHSVLERFGMYITAAWVEVCGAETLVASVHATIGGAAHWVHDIELEPSDFSSLKPEGNVWKQELAVLELSRLAGDAPLIVGGDWNSSRLLSQRSSDPGWHDRWCERLAARDWVETFDRLHENTDPRPPEPRTWFRTGNGFYQLDHIFMSRVLVDDVTDCTALTSFAEEGLSDHAPLVVKLPERHLARMPGDRVGAASAV
ncbi:MAG: hypothetical protein QOG53_3096 [Frankiales bacterium]|jgi:exonuclease III|nr:hypothetical protein [Frankiales bacterium]